jgi:hypothetical protein
MKRHRIPNGFVVPASSHGRKAGTGVAAAAIEVGLAIGVGSDVAPSGGVEVVARAGEPDGDGVAVAGATVAIGTGVAGT